MNVKQKLSILFYLKRKKITQDGMIPLYIRITIDGLEDEISLSCKVRAEHWDNDLKQVLPGEPAWKAINKRISQAKTDIERHFYGMQAKHGLVTPAIVKESYETPISGQQIRSEKIENMQLSEAVDQVIGDYLAYCEKRNRAYKNGRTPVPERLKLLDSEKEAVGERIQDRSERPMSYLIGRITARLSY